MQKCLLRSKDKASIKQNDPNIKKKVEDVSIIDCFYFAHVLIEDGC